MGPRAFARGDAGTIMRAGRPEFSLQWGRELSPAEMGPASTGAPFIQSRFNGAASFRPRRFADSRQQGQRGRSRFNGAASFRPRRSQPKVDAPF